MPTAVTPGAPPSVTVEWSYARMTIPVPLPALVPFVAKVHRVKTRRGKDYTVLRMTLPKEVGEKLSVGGNDFLFALAQKAQWYHMIDWSQMAEAWNILPPEMRAVLVHYGLISVSGTAESQTLQGQALSTLQLLPHGANISGSQ